MHAVGIQDFLPAQQDNAPVEELTSVAESLTRLALSKKSPFLRALRLFLTKQNRIILKKGPYTVIRCDLPAQKGGRYGESTMKILKNEKPIAEVSGLILPDAERISWGNFWSTSHAETLRSATSVLRGMAVSIASDHR